MFEGLNEQQKLQKAKEYHKEADAKDSKFQKTAREAFGFWRGTGQWTEDERSILEEERRHCLVFNVTKRFVDLVLGIYEDYAVQYFADPVEKSDGFLAEVLNKIAMWVRESDEFEQEIFTTRESATVSGRGWCGVDFHPDPKHITEQFIKIVPNNIPVYECRKDPSSIKKSGEDAGFLVWDKWINVDDFKIQFPKFANQAEEFLHSGKWMEIHEHPGDPEIFDTNFDSDSNEREFDRPIDSFYWDKKRNLIRIAHLEYWESYKRYYGWNPQTGLTEEFDEKDLSTLKETFPTLFGRKFDYFTVWDKKVKWLQFIGEKILYDSDSPVPYDEGFHIVPCVIFQDVSGRNTEEFGLVELIMDPQKEVNKRWSQSLNLINNQAQPGVYAEVDAFVDLKQAEASRKEAGGITWMKSGAIAGGRIKEREIPQFPNATIQMEELSQNIMLKITGVNPDLMGMDSGRQEPGVVVRLRQQQGVVLLRPVFKAFQQLDKEIFKRILSIIINSMPDAQILEILGQQGKYQIQDGIVIDTELQMQANIRDIRKLKYNIKSREIPGNRTYKMFMLSTLLELQNTGFPVDPAQIIEKLDISESEKRRWYQYIQSIQEAQQQAQEQEQQLKRAEIQGKMQLESQKIEADTVVKLAKVREQKIKDEQKHQLGVVQNQIEAESVLADHSIETVKAIAEDKKADAALIKAMKDDKPEKKAASGGK